MISLKALCIYRPYFRYFIHSDRVNRVLDCVIKRDFLRFNIIYILFRFAVVIIACYIYDARVAPVYLYIIIILYDVSVFIVSITLNDIIFSREDLDIIYLIINN